MNIVTILFCIATFLSLTLLVLSIVLPEEIKKKNGKVLRLPAALLWIKHEATALLCLSLCISFGILAAYSAIDKCKHCDRVVTSAYCIYCGEKNDDYIDNVSTLAGKNICPECQLPCDTPYCGDCGTQTVFVDK